MLTRIFHVFETFICKAFKGAAVPLAAGLQVLNNAANGRLGHARRMKIIEKLNYKIFGKNYHLTTRSKIVNNKLFSLLIKSSLGNFHEIFGLSIFVDNFDGSDIQFPARQHLYGSAVTPAAYKNRFIYSPFNITIFTSDLYWNLLYAEIRFTKGGILSCNLKTKMKTFGDYRRQFSDFQIDSFNLCIFKIGRY